MSGLGSTGREAVQAFFAYSLNRDDLQPGQVSYRFAGGVGLVCCLIGSGAVAALDEVGWGAAGVGALALLVGGGLCYFIQRLLIVGELEERRAQKAANHAEFERLARVTRSFQADQLGRALCRVVGRTHIDRALLRSFDTRHLFEQERTLFDEARLERKIGDLIDKSMRTISLGDAFCPEVAPVSRRVRGPGDEPGPLFFNPIRLVALLVTDSELVSCVVQIDCIGPNRHEEIRRIPLANIVDVIFEETREQLPASAETLDKLIEQLGYSESEAHEQFGKAEQRSGFRETRVTSRLALTSSDGGSLLVPIRSDVQLLNKSSALDPDDTLSVDELEIDHMVHTLSRLLRARGHPPGARGEEVRASMTNTRAPTVRSSVVKLPIRSAQ